MKLDIVMTERLKDLKNRTKRCCCKFCGGQLEIRRIIFSEDEEARIELFCSQCDRIEYGVELEIYQNAKYFVDRFQFNCFEDLENAQQTRKMNIAKVCEIMAWGDKNLGILDKDGFKVPVRNCSEIEDDCLVFTREKLNQER